MARGTGCDGTQKPQAATRSAASASMTVERVNTPAEDEATAALLYCLEGDVSDGLDHKTIADELLARLASDDPEAARRCKETAHRTFLAHLADAAAPAPVPAPMTPAEMHELIARKPGAVSEASHRVHRNLRRERARLEDVARFAAYTSA